MASVEIKTTWDGEPVDHRGIQMDVSACEGGIKLSADAPFFNDPKGPDGPPGGPFAELWENEG